MAGPDATDEDSVEEVVVYEEEEEESEFDDDMEVWSSSTHELVLLCQRHPKIYHFPNYLWVSVGMKVELQPQEPTPARNSDPGISIYNIVLYIF